MAGARAVWTGPSGRRPDVGHRRLAGAGRHRIASRQLTFRGFANAASSDRLDPGAKNLSLGGVVQSTAIV